MRIARRGHRPECELCGGSCAVLSASCGRLPQQRGQGRGPTEHLPQPGLIERHLLVRHPPEGADLLFLVSCGKGPLPEGKGQQRQQMLDLRVTVAHLPVADRFAGNAQQLGHAGLRQPDATAQPQHGLAKGIVSLAVGGSLHASTPSSCPPRERTVKEEGKRHGQYRGQCWALLCSGTSSILPDVGCAPRGSTRIGEELVDGQDPPDSSSVFISL